MKLLPLDTQDRIELVARWLAEEENAKWLDFGAGVGHLSPVQLKIMTQRELHVLRVYTADPDDVPVGITALSNVDQRFKTATVWFVLGDKRYRGCSSRATAMLLTHGFGELGLRAINAWTVEINVAARRLLERLHFKPIGRQRQCHYIDGRAYDRLWFDLLATEHRELER